MSVSFASSTVSSSDSVEIIWECLSQFAITFMQFGGVHEAEFREVLKPIAPLLLPNHTLEIEEVHHRADYQDNLLHSRGLFYVYECSYRGTFIGTKIIHKCQSTWCWTHVWRVTILMVFHPVPAVGDQGWNQLYYVFTPFWGSVSHVLINDVFAWWR